MSFRAYSAPEVMALSLSAHAGDGAFTSNIPSQCGTSALRGNGSAPVIGNTGYGLDLRTTATGAWSMNIGTSRCSMGGGVIPLPFDAGSLTPMAAGCWILTDSFVSFGGGANGAPVQIPLGIPALATLNGVDLYAQALILNFVPTSTIEATNGLAIGLGY